MDGMLAFTSTLAKEPGGQGLGSWVGLGTGRVTHVHHLVGCVQGLEAALVVLPKALQQGSAFNPALKHNSRTRPQMISQVSQYRPPTTISNRCC